MTQLALVTGAVGGIGSAVARRLAGDGFRVIAADMDADRAAALAAELPGSGHSGLGLDVTVEAAVAACFRQIEDAIAPINVVVNAAGILILDPNGQRRPITDIDLQEWEMTQRVNSTGTFLMVREYLRCRSARRVDPARFITFSSVAAQLGGYRSSSAYIASKAAVLGFTKAAAREAASLGVTVNAVAPGLIDAPMLRLSLDPAKDQEIAATIPLNRIGTSEDVAGAVSFLAGPDSSYLTGVTIDINGGYRMQ